MRLYSYVVARDYGFAPNPFYGRCTLATCKPRIRSVAQVGDWVVGTGSARYGLAGRLVYAMRVTEIMTFDEYWGREDFRSKRPSMRAGYMQAFGDNIYHRDKSGHWLQENSHHSYANGRINRHNLENDTQVDRVLASAQFAYWGGSGPQIPAKLRSFSGVDICALRNHKSEFTEMLVNEAEGWITSLGLMGYVGEPREWSDIKRLDPRR